MLQLIDEARAELEIKKSRFIAIAYPTKTLEEAKEKVLYTKDQYKDATHVVHASVVGDKGTMFSFSDDKEPKNTAGRPAFEVLKGSGITNITVCVVRYFGGTLLGTGGLVKAYGDSTKEVLKVARTEELVERTSFSLLLDYDDYALIKRALSSLNVANVIEDFGTRITIKGMVSNDQKDKLIKHALDIGQGKIEIIS